MIKELSVTWPATEAGWLKMYLPIKKTMVDIAKRVAKEQGWNTRWNRTPFGELALVLESKKVVEDKTSNIVITFENPKGIMKIDRDYRTPWPSVEGIQLNKYGITLLHVTEYKKFNYRKLSVVRTRFAKDLVEFMESIPAARYRHYD